MDDNVNYVAADLLGVREVVRMGERLVEPAHGARAVRSLLEMSYVEDEEATARVLADAGLNEAGVRLFRSMKVIARCDPEDGGGVQVQPFIPGLNDDALSNYSGSTDRSYHSVDEIVDDRKLEYKLGSLFSDVTLTDKLALSSKRMQTARRLAACDPAEAARGLTEYIQAHGFPNARVVAGEYAKSIARVRENIRAFADTIVYRDPHAMAHVTPTHLNITYDDFGDELLWTAFGPLKYATEVQAIYQLAIHYGPEYVMAILGVETATLQIHIRDESTNACYTGELEGYSSLEGVVPLGTTFPAHLTVEQTARLRAAADKVRPVMVDDVVVGTSVLVSDRHAILNEHTLAAADGADVTANVCGKPVVESRSVAHDIVVVSQPGISAQWTLRDAVVGERVVLCFSVGEDVEYSEVLIVNAFRDQQVILSDSSILRKGTSGAAVVALRDGALLGLFSTKRGVNVVCSAFGSSAFQVINDLASIVSSDAASEPADYGERTYGHMVEKGLLGFLEAVDTATASLYALTPRGKKCVGTVANVRGQWLTTANPDDAQLVLQDGTPMKFRANAVGGGYVAVQPPPVLAALPNVREVQPGERVFVFVKSGDEVAMTMVRTVTHVKTGGHEFLVEDFGEGEEVMSGGLVVAERDAAVVGQYARPDYDTFGAEAAVCYGFPCVGAADAQPVMAELDDSILGRSYRDWTYAGGAIEPLAATGSKILDLLAVRATQRRMGGVPCATTVTVQEYWSENFPAILKGFGCDGLLSLRGVGAESEMALVVVALAFMQDMRFLPVLEARFPEAVVGVVDGGGVEIGVRPTSTRAVHTTPLSLTEARLRQLEERVSALGTGGLGSPTSSTGGGTAVAAPTYLSFDS